ncbi:VirD4-like conjugal transfer protein, CD1115 family [Ruminococcus albus]|nr:type IV secretory system conjugative DNA transfer family protein [Ruminococcus albus]
MLAAVGACMDIAADDREKVDLDMLSKSLDSTLKDTHLVFELVKAGGYAAKIPMFAAFGIGLYALNKYTSKKKFHRKGEEHGSARWANSKEVKSLLDKPKKQKLPFKVKVHNFFERLKFWKKKDKTYTIDNNVVLTNEVKMSLNTRQTRKNLNVMVIGGSGSGKSRFYVKPNLMQANTSYVCTDPKGELLRSTGKMLEHYGYDIRVFNLIDMAHSNNYNPFEYIYDVDGHYSATAVIKMVNVLMKNTSKENSGGDQFWDDSTKALLAALCFYLVECEDKSRQNFSEVMKLLKKAEVKEGDDAYMSDLDLIFDALENPDKYTEEAGKIDKRVKDLNLIDLAKKDKQPHEYMCIKYYKDFKKAAGDTAKSILISTAVRLQAFNIPEVMDLTSCDNIHLETIGDKPVAMFIIIPSSDDTFNFLAAMMYTQLFDVLYDRANFKYGGRLPVHVRCLLDEFANLGQIPRFEELLATMRSMEISANVIIQNLSQLKKMYKDSWENVLGNCDSLLFLGGQEPTTLEHISKTLGKETIDTRSHNRTRGRQGSTSENDGILGRELMTVDELKTMKDNECILFVRGIFPFFCNKFKIEKHPNYKLLEDFNGDNAYLVKDVMTVKFGQAAETDDEDLHSEPAEDNEADDNTEHESAPENNNEEKELDCHVEDISVDSEQPHSRIAEMEAAKRLANIPKKPKNGKPEPASLDDEDTVVTTEPEMENDKDYICVNANDYLDNYDEF